MVSADNEPESSRGCGRRVLIIVENLPVPFDRRVWQEATTLKANGYGVSVICPTGRGYDRRYEVLDGVHIFRHPLPVEARGVLGYPLEYSIALFWQFVLAWRVLLTRGFDVIHACNPPDTIFIICAFFKLLFRKKFVFDQHDINPELYEAKFGRRDTIYRMLLWLERMTFKTSDISIATNKSFETIAIKRGLMSADRVFVVRSGPDLGRLYRVTPAPSFREGKRFLLGYVGIMGPQDGVHLLLRVVEHIVLRLRRNDCHCLIIGDGTEFISLKALARELQIQSYVTFTGYLTGHEFLEALSTIDVGVIPDPRNVYNNQIAMNKTFEYMALGIPFVQFELDEGRLLAGDAALYAKPNDPVALAENIVSLLDDPERRARMGAFGRRRVENELAWRYEAPKLLAAYDALWT